MKLLNLLQDGLIAPQLPDDIKYFSNRKVVQIEGQNYLLSDYTGDRQLVSDYPVHSYLSGKELLEIVVDPLNVNPVLPDFDDSDTSFTVYKGMDITVTGALPIPDQNFRVPFKRTDNGNITLMAAKVIDGMYTMILNFPEATKYVVNKDLVNSELPEPVFDIVEQTFYVINKPVT